MWQYITNDLSINSTCKQEMLDQWHNFDHAQVSKELVVFVRILAIEYQICSEHEDRRRENRQDF
jgi:hypothetical protein